MELTLLTITLVLKVQDSRMLKELVFQMVNIHPFNGTGMVQNHQYLYNIVLIQIFATMVVGMEWI